MKRVFVTAVLHNGEKYDEGRDYELDEKTAEALDRFIKELRKGEKVENSTNSSNDKPSSK